jgi:hypothetical protein
MLRHGPIQRNARARPLLQCRAKGLYRLQQTLHSPFLLAQSFQGIPKIMLRPRPIERRPRPRNLLKRLAISRNRFHQPVLIPFQLTQLRLRGAQFALRRCPLRDAARA